MGKERFFSSEGVAFVSTDDGMYRLEGDKRVRIEDPAMAVDIRFNSSVISRERAMELAAEF